MLKKTQWQSFSRMQNSSHLQIAFIQFSVTALFKFTNSFRQRYTIAMTNKQQHIPPNIDRSSAALITDCVRL